MADLYTLYVLGRKFASSGQYQSSLKCLHSALSMECDTNMFSKLNALIGIVHSYCDDDILAVTFLELACSVDFEKLVFDDVIYEAASLLSRIYTERLDYSQAESVLRRIIEVSNDNSYWYVRLMHELACLDFIQRDYQSALQVLELIMKFSIKNQLNIQSCLLFNKIIVYSAMGCCERAQSIIDNSNLPSLLGDDVESNSVYCILSIACKLSLGKYRDAGYFVTQLEELLNRLPPSIIGYELGVCRWLDPPHLRACAVISIASQQLHTDMVSNLNRLVSSATADTGVGFILNYYLQYILIISNLLMSNRSLAIDQIATLVSTGHLNSRFMASNVANTHFLLGLYSVMTNSFESAILQFVYVLETSKDMHFKSMTTANLVFMYLMCDKHDEFNSLILLTNSLLKEYPSDISLIVVKIIKAVTLIYLNQFNPAKVTIQEALVLSNANGFHRLSAMGFTVLGYVLLRLKKYQESADVLNEACTFCSMLKDSFIKVWALELQHNLMELNGQVEAAAHIGTLLANMRSASEVDIKKATQSRGNNLLSWLDGPPPS